MSTTLTKSKNWKALEKHFKEINKTHIKSLFKNDERRGENFVINKLGIYFDYSKHRITDETLKLLLKLAKERGVGRKRNAMFSGKKINKTENRAVLHTALRAPRGSKVIVDGKNVVPGVHSVLKKMATFSDKIRKGKWKGHTGKPIKNIVNIGIGGSDLGPVMAFEALKFYSNRSLTFRFVSNVDGSDFAEAVQDLNAEETLFIVASKTFTTMETMTNAETAKKWSLSHLKDKKSVAKHFVALSTNKKAVTKFGINPTNMFGFWDWVGGRYSMTASIGLSLMIAIGSSHYKDMLNGFYQMDEHFRTAPLKENIPVIMGLIGMWNNNCLLYTSPSPRD